MDHECTLGDYVSADVGFSLADRLTKSGIKLRLELVIKPGRKSLNGS